MFISRRRNIQVQPPQSILFSVFKLFECTINYLHNTHKEEETAEGRKNIKITHFYIYRHNFLIIAKYKLQNTNLQMFLFHSDMQFTIFFYLRCTNCCLPTLCALFGIHWPALYLVWCSLYNYSWWMCNRAAWLPSYNNNTFTGGLA